MRKKRTVTAASQPTTNVLASSLTPSLPNPFCATAFVLKIHHPPPGPEPHMKASSNLRRTSCVVFGPSFHWLRGLLLTFDFLQIEWFYCNIKLCCQYLVCSLFVKFMIFVEKVFSLLHCCLHLFTGAVEIEVWPSDAHNVQLTQSVSWWGVAIRDITAPHSTKKIRDITPPQNTKKRHIALAAEESNS